MGCTSLRVRLLIVATACVVVTLMVAGASLVLLFERQVLRMVGEDLDMRWAELSRTVVIDEHGRPDLSPPPPDPRYQTPHSGAYWQITEKGEVAARSASLMGEKIETTGHEEERRAGLWFEVVTQSMGELYILERDVTTHADGSAQSVKLAVALDHGGVAAARDNFQWDVARVLGLLALLLIGAAALQMGLTLQPLKRLDVELAAIRGGRRRGSSRRSRRRSRRSSRISTCCSTARRGWSRRRANEPARWRTG